MASTGAGGYVNRQTQTTMLCRICFWLQSAMFITNAFLGPFFQLGAQSTVKDNFLEAASQVVCIAEWTLRLAIATATIVWLKLMHFGIGIRENKPKDT